MGGFTTIEADPRGAISFLRALKKKDIQEFHPDRYEMDWFTRSEKK